MHQPGVSFVSPISHVPGHCHEARCLVGDPERLEVSQDESERGREGRRELTGGCGRLPVIKGVILPVIVYPACLGGLSVFE